MKSNTTRTETIPNADRHATAYERAELRITEFRREDAIATSGLPTLTMTKTLYEHSLRS